MEKQILFHETQRFTQWWLWVILLGPTGLFAFGIFQQMVLGMPFGTRPASDAALIIIFLFLLLMILLFALLRLETQIREDGIYVRFIPWHKDFKYYPWNSINKVYIHKYKPILEYGGWGLRGLGSDRALNVSGNQGIQLELMENKKMLIGTKKPNEANAVLERINKSH